MLRLPSVALIVVLVFAACAEVPPAPGTGGSGGGGTGAAGAGGMGGNAGVGGSGGVDPCALVVLEPDEETVESTDNVSVDGKVSAFLCSGERCAPEDLFDSWSFTIAPACMATYQMIVTWDNNLDDDLGLVLLDSNGELDRADERIARGTDKVQLTEEITWPLESREPYVLHVTAFNTSGNERNYRLEVLLVD